MTPKKDLELYLHIPFCRQKCRYCDFLSAPLAVGTPESCTSSSLYNFLVVIDTSI